MKKSKKQHHSSIIQTNKKEPAVDIVDGFGLKKRMTLPQAMAIAKGYAQRNGEHTAQSIYCQLIEQCPQRWEPAVSLMNSHWLTGNPNAAQLQAYRLQSLFRSNANVVVAIAQFYNLKGESDKAMDLLSESLKNCPEENHAALYRTIGKTYSNQGEHQRAADFFWKALAIDENDILSLYNLTNLEKDRSRDTLLKKLLALENSNSVATGELPFIHFSLAYLYERHDKKKYFSHLKIANDAVAQDSTHYFTQLNSHYQQIRSVFNSEGSTAHYPHKAKAARAPIFIIAPPRSGTTLVEQILSTHPETTAVGESSAILSSLNRAINELGGYSQFFSQDEEIQKKAYSSLENYFFKHDRIPANPDLVIVDKSIENFQHAGLILRMWPGVRIIRLKRHPLDTILSCYHQFFGGSHECFFDLTSLAHYYIAVQKYMDFWQELFPDNVMNLEYEALVNDQKPQTRRLLEFCQLNWNEDCLNFHHHVGTVLTVSNLQVRESLNNKSIGKWKQFRDELQPAIRILERDLPEFRGQFTEFR